MNNYQGRNNPKKFIHSKLMLFIFGIFLLFFSFNVIKFAIKAVDTAKNKDNAQTKVTQLQTKKDQLNKDITDLNTQNGVENTIRDKFGLAKDGEGLVIITDNPDQIKQNNNNSFWSKVKGLFK